MKVKSLILGLGLGGLLFAGCNDELSLVGPSIQPEEDAITVYNDTFRIQATTVKMDGVYARADSALLGEIYDPLYGNLKSDYMCQFYCPDGYNFAHTPLEGKIDSVDFKLYYAYLDRSYNRVASVIGDSLVPMTVGVYPLNEPLQKKFYTNFDPSEYCDMENLAGTKTYTARPSIGYVTVNLPQEMGQKFYEETINNPASFSSQEAFNKFFPGFYVTTTYGTGSLVGVSNTYFTIYYKYEGTSTSTGKDTIMQAAEQFSVTQEIVQLSRFKNTDMDALLAPNDAYTYLKSPAGVCTRLTIPLREMADKLEGHILNNLPLTLQAMPQENWLYAFQATPSLLILPEDSVKSFFEAEQMYDSKISYLANYSAASLSYSFGNISSLIQYQLEKDKTKDLNLLVVPVQRNVSTSTNSFGQSYEVVNSIGNYMSPSGTRLRKDDEVTEIVVTSCKYN